MTSNPSTQVIEALRRVLLDFPGWSKVDLADRELTEADCWIKAWVRGQVFEFQLDVKSGSWRPEALQRIQNQSFQSIIPIVLASAWISPKLAKSLREMGMNYLDTAGNAFLDFPGLQVFRETNALPLVDPRPKRPAGGAFNASAVRVGLQLLLDPELVQSNLRHIATLAGVSAPSAKFAMDAFKSDGYVLDAGKKGRRLVDREAFFRKWTESYNQRYRPRHSFGRYSSGLGKLDLKGCEACWGGEPAADRLTNNLEPGMQTVYAYTTKIGALIAKNQLRSQPEGDVELVQACWGKHNEGPQGTAPAFVVFADLKNERDPRCDEVAEQIFESLLREKLNASLS